MPIVDMRNQSHSNNDAAANKSFEALYIIIVALVHLMFSDTLDPADKDDVTQEVSTTTLEQLAEVNGTPAYMAPEQFRGRASRRSDQYSLGCIMYELVTGRRPFTAPDAISMGLKHMQEAPIPPTWLNPNLSPQIEHVILKALAKRRINRYPDILTFIQELQVLSITQTPLSIQRPTLSRSWVRRRNSF